MIRVIMMRMWMMRVLMVKALTRVFMMRMSIGSTYHESVDDEGEGER